MTRPNVILIVLDTARADMVFSGLDDGWLPTLETISDEGTTFRNAMSTAPWTLPSHASLFTGQYTTSHGTHAGSKNFDPEPPTLAEHLNDAGYETVGISGNTWISPEFGFDRGFDEFAMKWDLFWDSPDLATVAQEETIVDQFREVVRRTAPIELPKALAQAFYSKFIAGRYDDGARASTTRAIDWIEGQRDESRPFFMFLNYLEPHLPYEPPSEYWEAFLPDDVDRKTAVAVNQDQWAYISGAVSMDELDFQILKSLYRAELAYLDTQISRLLNTVEQESIVDDTVIVIVGDHGENIGDHQLMDHQYCLYDTLLHVPLMIRYPEEFPEKETVSGIVESRDVFTTILELAGVEQGSHAEVSTNSLVPDSEGLVSTREFAISEYVTPQPAIETLVEQYDCSRDSLAEYDRALRSIRTETWKFIQESDGSTELFDLDSSTEVDDVSANRDDLTAEFENTLREHRGTLQVGSQDTRDISSSSKERLEDLGYL